MRLGELQKQTRGHVDPTTTDAATAAGPRIPSCTAVICGVDALTVVVCRIDNSTAKNDGSSRTDCEHFTIADGEQNFEDVTM